MTSINIDFHNKYFRSAPNSRQSNRSNEEDIWRNGKTKNKSNPNWWCRFGCWRCETQHWQSNCKPQQNAVSVFVCAARNVMLTILRWNGQIKNWRNSKTSKLATSMSSVRGACIHATIVQIKQLIWSFFCLFGQASLCACFLAPHNVSSCQKPQFFFHYSFFFPLCSIRQDFPGWACMWKRLNFLAEPRLPKSWNQVNNHKCQW